MNRRIMGLGIVFFVLYFVVGLFLGGLALLWSSDYQWWAFVLVILLPALLSSATLAVLEGRRKTPSI
jgi:hypothetical protein